MTDAPNIDDRLIVLCLDKVLKLNKLISTTTIIRFLKSTCNRAVNVHVEEDESEENVNFVSQAAQFPGE